MDVDANAEQDDRFPLESMSGGFAERKWHVEKQETKEFLEKISVKIFYFFLKYFLLLVCLLFFFCAGKLFGFTMLNLLSLTCY